MKMFGLFLVLSPLRICLFPGLHVVMARRSRVQRPPAQPAAGGGRLRVPAPVQPHPQPGAGLRHGRAEVRDLKAARSRRCRRGKVTTNSFDFCPSCAYFFKPQKVVLD